MNTRAKLQLIDKSITDLQLSQQSRKATNTNTTFNSQSPYISSSLKLESLSSSQHNSQIDPPILKMYEVDDLSVFEEIQQQQQQIIEQKFLFKILNFHPLHS
ncbi:unnamed protein product [Rotaria magnacalcarata]|uniref:Uncharacterized protein n=1 Tax=Rotaria magnacalcarata TaxID=392030 RepID=A0A819P024_9BILA|nr:unnamed protein product [Rotaria magnacalcarata]CAF2114655.1 unnamed protein product [Rotaria magnacalcarata]CAF4008096.1 unnamed protein product [Rotaria magnacalcarata]CAF4339598.1 unnamed protein product [Rotaria magnacalcarata]CAF5212633.1 unnamed protein product [Rotaria magnacalcarata]